MKIDARLVRSLLRSQFPHLSELECYEVGEGFDNSLWRLGDDLVVRLPRREAAVTLARNELRWLHEVARNVTLATPLPLMAGVSSDDYPWPWSIVSWIDGVPGDEIDLDTNDGAASGLATFLREIHVDAPPDAPLNPYRGVALSARSAALGERLTQIRDHVAGGALLELWEHCLTAPPWAAPPRWLHGDFHPANTLYRDDELVGIIDFGDLCAGDPATDLAGGLMSLPYRALDEFFAAYGSIDDATLQRTIGWAVLFGVFMVSIGLDDRANYLGVGDRTLANATRLARRL